MREMKDSGVSWIGVIPKDWAVHRIKTIFSERTELSETGREILMSVSEYYGVDSRSSHIEEDEYLSRSESLVGYKKCFPGDIVSNIMLAWKGSLGVARQAGIVSPAYCVYKPSNEIIPLYYHYLFRTALYTWQFKCYSKGIIDSRLRLYSPFFYDIPALIPPISEQQCIADVLDTKFKEIDTILEKTKASIEEYKKLKQSIITESVTKGIYGDNRPMKDSGFEWIGEIPAEWKIMKLRSIGRAQNGISKGSDCFGTGTPFVSYSDVYKNAILPRTINGLVQSTEQEQEIFSVCSGDIFFTRTSETIEEIGFSSVCLDSIPKAVYAGFLIRLRPKDDTVLPCYSKYYFRSDIPRYFFVKEMNLVTRASLSQDLLKSLPVLIPSREEQQEIATYLDEKCATIDILIASKEELISELESYKQSLVYEYVTGKKEVLVQEGGLS